MPRSPDDKILDAEPAAIETMQRLQMALANCSQEEAFEAVGNIMVLLAVGATQSKAEAHGALDDEWVMLHECLESNYIEACRMKAAAERCGATVH